MKFFKLTLSTDEKIIGRYPQSIEMITIGDWGLKENFQLGYFGPIKNLGRLPETKIQDNAIATDIVESAYLRESFFLIMNQKFVDFLIQFKIPAYELFESPVHHKKVIHNYKLFHIEYPSNDLFINFRKSEFYIGKRGLPPSDLLVEIHHFKEYLKRQKQTKLEHPGNNLLCKKLILDLSKCEYDLFRLAVVPALGYFVSERLKNSIESKGFTGLDFKEIEEDPKIEVIN